MDAPGPQGTAAQALGELTPVVNMLGELMPLDDLHKTHDLYRDNIDEWNFMLAAYEGVRELLALGHIKKHEREGSENWKRRRGELYGFGYTKSIVHLFTFYLFKREVKRNWGDLKNNELLQLFLDDCDLYGSTFGEFISEQSRFASIFGHIGILIDKPSTQVQTRADETSQGIYPYVSAYFPTAILDWEYKRNENNRPYLAYLKLRDDDGMYRLWWPDRWEVWQEKRQESGKQQAAELIASGLNALGEIPFVWLYNLKGSTRPLGASDITEISRIDVSIIRNLSQGEEVVGFGAFPMMRKPKIDAALVGSIEDNVGPTAVLEFDPEQPESKPDWLPSEVAAPLGAIMAWIERKVAEIYRASNAGGMAGTEVSTVAKSGVALNAEFQMLNSILVQKAINGEKCERGIVWYWLKWMGMGVAEYDKVEIERPRTYDVQNLAQDLENLLTSLTMVNSRKYQENIEKGVARRMLPAATEDQLLEIDKEIEAYEEHAYRPRNVVEFVTTEQEELGVDTQKAALQKAEADAKKTEADAKKALKPPEPVPPQLQQQIPGQQPIPPNPFVKNASNVKP